MIRKAWPRPLETCTNHGLRIWFCAENRLKLDGEPPVEHSRTSINGQIVSVDLNIFKSGPFWMHSNLVLFEHIQIWSVLNAFKSGAFWMRSNRLWVSVYSPESCYASESELNEVCATHICRALWADIRQLYISAIHNCCIFRPYPTVGCSPKIQLSYISTISNSRTFRPYPTDGYLFITSGKYDICRGTEQE